MSFRTIRTDINGPFLLSKYHIAAATHDEEVRCGAGGHPKAGIIRTETSLYHHDHREREHGFDAVSFRTIRTDINGPFLLSQC